VYRPAELGSLLKRLCQERGLTAAAASRRAGVSVNEVRNIQRGFHRPGPRVIAAITESLALDRATTAKLRRLAGIDPDPAATPEAKRARAAAWRFLTYMLANHVLLPRLSLADTITRLAHKSPAATEHLRAAAAAAVGRDYCRVRPETPAAPRALRALIEKTFAHLTADDIQSTQPRGLASPGRVTAVSVLLGMVPLPRGWTEAEAFDVACNAEFGPFFALRLFPLIYREACRCWPFEKVYMPYGLHGQSVQRAVYDLAHSAGSVLDFDQALVGCGAEIARGRLSRWRRPGGGLPEPPDRDERPEPPGSPDFIFDHWDRCEFLDQFPLLRLDHEGSTRLAHSVDLPSLEAYRVQLERRGVPRDLILSEAFEGEPLELARLPGPDSFIARLIAEQFRVAAERRIKGQQWAEIASAGQTLQMDWQVIALADSLARRPPDTPGPP